MMGRAAAWRQQVLGAMLLSFAALAVANDSGKTSAVLATAADSVPADAQAPANGIASAELPNAEASHSQNEAVRLVYKFSPGQFVGYEVSKRVRYVTTQAENTFDAVHSSIERKHFRVVSINDDGSALLEPVLDHVKMSAQFDSKQSVTFDSSSDLVAPREFKGIQQTVGRPMARFLVDPNGRLIKILVVAKDPPKALSDAAAKPDASINFLTVLPTEPVRPGYQWKEDFETTISVGRGLTQKSPLRRQYELVSVKDGIATIKFRTKSLAPTNDPEIVRQIVQQTPTGVIEFDVKRGLVRSQTSKISESVVGAFGAQSVLQVVGDSNEKLTDAESEVKQVGSTTDNNPTRSRVTPANATILKD